MLEGECRQQRKVQQGSFWPLLMVEGGGRERNLRPLVPAGLGLSHLYPWKLLVGATQCQMPPDYTASPSFIPSLPA